MSDTCLVCLEYIDNDNVWICDTCKVSIHTSCKITWEARGNNSCPHCRQTIIEQTPRSTLTHAYITDRDTHTDTPTHVHIYSPPIREFRELDLRYTEPYPCPIRATHRSYYFCCGIVFVVLVGAMSYLLFEIVSIKFAIINMTRPF